MFANDTTTYLQNQPPCQAVQPDGSICGQTESLRILQEFHKIYDDRLKLLENEGDCALQLKNEVLLEWVRDLTVQNTMMAQTIQEMEREACQRVSLLENRLRNAEKAEQALLDHTERQAATEVMLHTESCLYEDISGLLEVLRRAREERRWSADGIKFHGLTCTDIFGPSYDKQAVDATNSHMTQSNNCPSVKVPEFQEHCGSQFTNSMESHTLASNLNQCPDRLNKKKLKNNMNLAQTKTKLQLQSLQYNIPNNDDML